MASEIRKIHADLTAGTYTCTELIKQKLSLLQANEYNSNNSVLTEIALAKAAAVDAKIKSGQPIGLLEGIPFGLKDVYLLQGTVSTASSDMLRNYVAPYTATAIQKLLDAGAIPVARENCDTFGHGSTSENTVFGPVKNALNPALVAGGSSGGSAVNVAKGYTAFSIGGDTGGSIRQPAGYNKVYGLKPTYGRISRYGLMAYASSTDCVGPFANNLEDILILLNIMSGHDYHDQTSFDAEPVSESVLTAKSNASQFRVGYYRSFVENPALDPKIKADFMACIEKLKAAGAKVQELDFYDVDTLVATYYMLAMAETASNLARLDGTNYGARADEKSLKEGYMVCRSENFTTETKRRIVGGNQVLSQGHSEEIYLKARSLRNQIMQSFDKEFTELDIVLSPVAPGMPPVIGDNLKKPLSMYLSDAYTVGFSLGGLPTLTAPVGTEIGIQITAAKAQEQTIIQFAQLLNELL